MGLVSLGACFFTISSIMAFKSSTMGWDASRVTAALPSGVGFLGGALIWKGSVFVEELGREKQQVHGLTTAASLWLSAALGVGAGGALYAVTIYAMALVLFVLRYGPKLYDADEEDDEEGDDEEEEVEDIRQVEIGQRGDLEAEAQQQIAEQEGPLPRRQDNEADEASEAQILAPAAADSEGEAEVLMPREELMRRLSEQPQNVPRLQTVTVVQKFNPERGIPHRRLKPRKRRSHNVPTFGS